MAVPTITIYAAHPRDTDTRSERQFCCCAFHHLSNNLVAKDKFRSKWRQISFHDVQISATDPAGNYPKQDVSSLKLGTGHILNF
jgi:hypothetical protein